jgi:hypothetical protein
MRIKEILEGEYLGTLPWARTPAGDLQKDKNKQPIWTPDWQQKKTALEARCLTMFNRLVKVADPKFAQRLSQVKIEVDVSPFGPAYAFTNLISIDITAFWDAPDDALAFVIAHEMGHIVGNHHHSKSISAKKQELAADRYGISLAQKLGYNKAVVFKFVYSKEDYKRANTPHPQADHPTIDQRSKEAKKIGFQLSKAGQDQLTDLQQALA